MAAKAKISEGSVVRLKRDVKTRGGRTFKAGVKMYVSNYFGEINLRCRVRNKNFYLTLKKRDEPFYLELVTPAAAKEE